MAAFVDSSRILPDPDENPPINEEKAHTGQDVFSNHENCIIVTSVRMNPPTVGHFRIIAALCEKAIEHEITNVYVLLSQSTGYDDPLLCLEKIGFLTKMITQFKINNPKFAEININCICASPFNGITQLIFGNTLHSRPISVIIILGNDKGPMYRSIVKFNMDVQADLKKKEPESFKVLEFEHVELHREDIDGKNPKDLSKSELIDIQVIDPPAVSGSLIRKLVKYELKELFIQLYSTLLNEEEDINVLYTTIQSGMVRGLKEMIDTDLTQLTPPRKSSFVKLVKDIRKTDSDPDINTEIQDLLIQLFEKHPDSSKTRKASTRKIRVKRLPVKRLPVKPLFVKRLPVNVKNSVKMKKMKNPVKMKKKKKKKTKTPEVVN